MPLVLLFLIVSVVHSAETLKRTLKNRLTSPDLEGKASFCLRCVKLSYISRPAELHGHRCFLLSTFIVFKLNFNLLLCLQKGKSNQLYYIYKYSYWIVHIAGGAGGEKKQGLGVRQHKHRGMKKNEAIKRRPKEENVKLPEQKCSCLCPRFLFTLAARVRPWMAAAARRVEPAPAWDDDWYGHISPLAEDGIPVRPGANFCFTLPA